MREHTHWAGHCNAATYCLGAPVPLRLVITDGPAVSINATVLPGRRTALWAVVADAATISNLAVDRACNQDATMRWL